MSKFKYKEGMSMFSDEILEKIFAIEEMQKLTITEQSMLVDKFEQIVDEMEVNNATISES